MKYSAKTLLSLAALFVSSLILISSCKKENNSDANLNGATAMAADGSGFKDVFSADISTLGVGGLQGNVEVPDFTIEGTRLHIIYAGITVYQQSNGAQVVRRTVELATGAVIPQPAGADTVLAGYALPSSEYQRGPTLFLPYRNFFTYNKFRSNGQRRESSFSGDLESFYSVYHGFSPSLGFRYPVHNLGSTAEGSLSIGPAPTPPSYQSKVYQPKEVAYPRTFGGTHHAMIVEGYRNSYQDSIFCIVFRQDSIIAYTVSENAAGNLYVFRKAAGIEAFPSMPNVVLRGDKLIRHYDPSGTKLAVAILGEHTYTFTFDFTTLDFALGVNDFAGPHYDLANTDVDDKGNLYYADKNAGFGATTVYKRSVAGVTSVVGSDKPLRYGQIVRVKYLLGKVYIGATGRQVGAEETHVAVLQLQ